MNNETKAVDVLAPLGLRAFSYGPRGNQWCVSDECGYLYAEACASRELAERSALAAVGVQS